MILRSIEESFCQQRAPRGRCLCNNRTLSDISHCAVVVVSQWYPSILRYAISIAAGDDGIVGMLQRGAIDTHQDGFEE